jgi:hypothetical protein
MYEPGTLDADDVASAIDAAFSDLAAEKATWPAVTDCDLLDQAFSALGEGGIIALQNAGNEQSDGLSEVRPVYEDSAERAKIRGYCFYHGQVLERAVRGGGLFLSFGPIDPKEEQRRGAEIGRVIQEELERVGFEVTWKGTFSDRICLPKIVWQRW